MRRARAAVGFAFAVAAAAGCASTTHDAGGSPTPVASDTPATPMATTTGQTSGTATHTATSTPTLGPTVAHLYVAAGDGGGNPYAQTWSAGVTALGELHPWASAQPMPGGLSLGAAGSCAAPNVYLAGGYSDFNFVTPLSASYAAALSGGSFVSWSAGPALPAAVGACAGACASFAGSDYFYVIGGDLTGGTNQTPGGAVHVAPVSGASVGAWNATTPLPAPLLSAAAMGYAGYVYVVGGDASGLPSPAYASAVYSAAVGASGQLSAWTQAGTLPAGRAAHSMALEGSYLLVVGGEPVAAVGRSVLSAPLLPGGGIGAFASQPALPAGFPLRYGAAARSPGFLHAIGGWTGSTGARSTVFTAAVAGGTVSAWASARPFPTAVNNQAAAPVM